MVMGLITAGLGAVGAATGLAGDLFGMTQGGSGLSNEEASWRDFTRAIEPVGTFMNQTYMNPMYQANGGTPMPFSRDYPLPEDNRDTVYAPSQATENLYAGYLSRQYGLPDSMASAITNQAMLPVRNQGLKGGNLNQGGAREAFDFDPQKAATAQLGRQAPAALRNMDYLQNAGSLAQYNLFKAQQLPKLIG